MRSRKEKPTAKENNVDQEGNTQSQSGDVKEDLTPESNKDTLTARFPDQAPDDVARMVDLPEVTPPSKSPRKIGSMSSLQTLEPTTMPSLPMQKMTKVINLADLMQKVDRPLEKSYTAHSRTPEYLRQKDNGNPLADQQTQNYVPAVINQEEFDKKYGFRRVDLSLITRIYHYVAEARRWSYIQWIWFVRGFFPITQWLADYDWKHDLLMDFIGGVMLAIMSIPQGLAYGLLVGLKPTHGLYTCIVGPLVYAVLGTSKHASPGAFAITALMVGVAVEQVGTLNDSMRTEVLNTTYFCCSRSKRMDVAPEAALQIVTCLTVCVGLIQIAFGILNVGLLAVWMSDHLVQGLTSGAAIHVLTSQITTMTGVENVPGTADTSGMAKNITTIKWNTASTSVVVCLTLIFSKEILDPIFVKWLKIKFPMEFFVVLFSVLLCYFSDGTDYDLDIKIVGPVQPGMIPPFVPDFGYAGAVIPSALSIAVVSFVIHVALAKLISKKLNYSVDANQEWFALGMMNFIAAFFGCFAGGSSLSRTITSVKLGSKSQMSTIVCACVLILSVYFATPLLFYLPQPVLACIVVVALKDLFVQIGQSVKLMQKSMFDFLIWFVTFVSVILLNVNWGLLCGVVFALLTVVFRSQWAESTCMGRIPETTDFKGLDHYREAAELPGIRVFRFDAPLYFANSELFLRRLHLALGVDPVMAYTKLKAEREKRKGEALSQTPDPSVKTVAKRLNPVVDDRTPIELNVRTRYANSKEITASPDQEKQPQMGTKPEGKKREEEYIHLSHFIIDCSSFPYIDLMGLEVLEQAYSDLSNMGIRVFFCNCKVAVRQFFEQNEFYKRVPKSNMYCSLIPAIIQAEIEREQEKQKKEQKIKE
ncbi:unnamed protein product [Bursaphelenchus xylophilus]|uniref:(pine wood nematode) hypothetical protein n=1 Tax=Bursaphelenchus xylophilus TaxID=6326 RepID=A0A1I7RRR2_BURXY|nr:unnamed protein product [Bursaphelenchus xylophilus]CAG9123530.1 unnamed protein product [Bursaphelenchus xylophilus]